MSRPVLKTWLAPPENPLPTHVIVIGVGIAGATTANALAQRGIRVTVLEQGSHIAHGASGNHQGLLYAKITAADTPQNRLLKQAYPFVLNHLNEYFQGASFWDDCGLLQLAFNETEQQRQEKLLKTAYSHIQAWNGGVENQFSHSQGLWWPQGAWVSPPRWIEALLNHPLIQTITHQKVNALQWQDSQWQVHTPNQTHTASHVIICAGYQSDELAQTQNLGLRRIRGQVAYAPTHPQAPKHAVNASHYFIPAFENQHTFGATFVFNDDDDSFRMAEHQHNLVHLKNLLPALDFDIALQQKPLGRASIRADSIDHLPIVGPVGNAPLMQKVYAKLRQDKHYLIDSKCPYHPNLWINTAHGTRGMLTAPLCAESLARRLCHQDDVLSQDLQDALHPNRLPIRQLIYPNSNA